MPESSASDFSRFEEDLHYDFATLAARIRADYAAIDQLAHINGSEHSDDERLFTNIDIDGQERFCYFEQRATGFVLASVADNTGQPVFSCQCSIAEAESQSGSPGGKHAAVPLQPESATDGRAGGFSRLTHMLMVATTLESTFQVVVATGAAVIAYDN